MPNVLTLKKLRTSEDDGHQQELANIPRADVFARDIVLAGALLQGEAEDARLDEAIDDLVEKDMERRGVVVNDDDERSSRERWMRAEWAYRLGIAVGLRLRGLW